MSEETKQEEVDIEVTPEDNPLADGILITKSAAKLVCEIITVCTKRGAFNPNELALVGTLFDQMNAQLPAGDQIAAAPDTGEKAEEKTEDK